MDEMDPKAENIMMNIWNGNEASKCDGNWYGYSHMVHVMNTKVKKSKDADFWQVVSNFFEPNFSVDYPFQYKYRSKAISFYFVKEFMCALSMLILF
jgi:hypothetical protein